MTINQVIRDAQASLEAVGIDTPRLDAEVLLAHVLQCGRIDLILRRDEPLAEKQRAQFDGVIAERMARRPVSQIIGSRGFWSLDVAVNEHVLTPRPETEGIVERAQRCFPADAAIDILDIGTGSGCIAAALAVEFPRARITATDICPEALAAARKNLTFARDRIELLEGDLFEVFGSRVTGHASRPFELIVSNPPYIPEGDLANLAPEVRDHEPRLALTAGPDGLAILKKIIKYAPQHLAVGGWLVLEIGIGQASAVRDMIEAEGAYSPVSIDRDLTGIERIIAARKM